MAFRTPTPLKSVERQNGQRAADMLDLPAALSCFTAGITCGLDLFRRAQVGFRYFHLVFGARYLALVPLQ